MALVTLEQFAAYWQRDLSPEDAYTAQMLIGMATDDIQGHCGWHIAPAVTETVTVDGSGGSVQALPTLLLTDVVSVTEDGTAVDLDAADVQWSAAGYLSRAVPWTRRLRGITAEIQHGYAVTPPGLVRLLCELVARSMTKPSGVAREQSGGESVAYELAEMTEQELRILDRRYTLESRP